MEQNAFYQRGYFLGGEDSDQTHTSTHIHTHTHTQNARVYSASSVVPDPVDCSPLGSSVEWVAISSFKTQLPM